MVQGAVGRYITGQVGPQGIQGVQGVPGVAGQDVISTPYPAVETRVIAGRIAQIVETRPDGTKNTSTLTYVGDQVTVMRQDNPAKTFTFTYAGSSLTGWSVA
jgi:hypothetical protein